MRIGILTQPLWGNYGGILQNYALQQVIRQYGHIPITLDFLWGYSGLQYCMYQAYRIILKCVGRYKGDWRLPYAPYRDNPVMEKFILENINKTHPFWNKYSSKLVRQYDLNALIVGSDQVWRAKYNPDLESMFLGFAEKYEKMPKVAYAASFGTSELEFDGKQRSMAMRLLSRFSAISVRESDGMELVKELGADARTVLDPTLLLGRSGFEKLLLSTDKQNKLSSYILDWTSEIEEKVMNISDELGMDCVVKLQENTDDIGPKEWLTIIHSSDFFITDSFHGTVFCILFHVPFLTIINENRGKSRFLSLLEPLNLQNRLLSHQSFKNSTSEIVDLMKSPIDWENIDRLLALKREESRQFLFDAICI